MKISDLPEVRPGYVRLAHSTHRDVNDIDASLQEYGLFYTHTPDSTMDVMGGTGRWKLPFKNYLINDPRSAWGENVILIDIPIMAYKEWKDIGTYRNDDEPESFTHRPGGKRLIRRFTQKKVGVNDYNKQDQYSTGKGSIIGIWNKDELKDELLSQRKKKSTKTKVIRKPIKKIKVCRCK